MWNLFLMSGYVSIIDLATCALIPSKACCCWEPQLNLVIFFVSSASRLISLARFGMWFLMKLIVLMNSRTRQTVFSGAILRMAWTLLYPCFVRLNPTNAILCATNLLFVAFTCISALPRSSRILSRPLRCSLNLHPFVCKILSRYGHRALFLSGANSATIRPWKISVAMTSWGITIHSNMPNGSTIVQIFCDASFNGIKRNPMFRSSVVPYSNPDTPLMRSLIVGIGQLLRTTCGLSVRKSKTKWIVPSFLGTPKTRNAQSHSSYSLPDNFLSVPM